MLFCSSSLVVCRFCSRSEDHQRTCFILKPTPPSEWILDALDFEYDEPQAKPGACEITRIFALLFPLIEFLTTEDEVCFFACSKRLNEKYKQNSHRLVANKSV